MAPDLYVAYYHEDKLIARSNQYALHFMGERNNMLIIWVANYHGIKPDSKVVYEFTPEDYAVWSLYPQDSGKYPYQYAKVMSLYDPATGMSSQCKPPRDYTQLLAVAAVLLVIMTYCVIML